MALGVGGVAAGIAAAVSNDEPETSSVELVSSSPPTGSTISMASFALSVRVRVRSNRDVAAGSLVLGLRPADQTAFCVTLLGAHPGLTTQQAQLVVRGPGETDAFRGDLPLSYSFVP